MHSSRMRTGRWLTVCQSLLPGGVGGGAGVGVMGESKKKIKKNQKKIQKKIPQKNIGGVVYLVLGGCT